MCIKIMVGLNIGSKQDPSAKHSSPNVSKVRITVTEYQDSQKSRILIWRGIHGPAGQAGRY